MIDLTPLMPLMDREATEDAKRSVPNPPDRIVAGNLGLLRFVVVVDNDGWCEASFSAQGRWQPSKGMIRAFWRKWGVEPVYPAPTVILKGRDSVRRGNT